MSYTVTLKDGSTYALDEEEGESLKTHWLDAKKPFTIELGDDVMSSVEIRKIKKNAALPLHKMPGNDPKLLANGCRGVKSINLALISVVRGLGDPRLLKDKEWRTEMKKSLKEQGSYCDTETGECACPKIPSNKGEFLL